MYRSVRLASSLAAALPDGLLTILRYCHVSVVLRHFIGMFRMNRVFHILLAGHLAQPVHTTFSPAESV
jgi:hypothetical protein